MSKSGECKSKTLTFVTLYGPLRSKYGSSNLAKYELLRNVG